MANKLTHKPCTGTEATICAAADRSAAEMDATAVRSKLFKASNACKCNIERIEVVGGCMEGTVEAGGKERETGRESRASRSGR